jgi:3-oxoacyl-[acyl-carrier protein] reductase
MGEQRFKDRVVVITGAGGGIGRATALRFAREGARIAAWDIADKAAPELLYEIEQAGGEAMFQVVNVTDSVRVEEAANEVVARWGGIDVLINNAGILRDAQLIRRKGDEPLRALPEEQWDAVLDTNLKGVFLVTRAVVPHLMRRGGGVVLSAASVVGLYGNFGQTSYVASKAGVIGLTRTWARELGKHGIRVNAVAPGFIATEMTRGMPQDVLDTMVKHTPIGRMGTAEDIANAYAWLASDEASFVHGTVLSVDGGVVVGT